jgi:segregation and condensation protein A
MKGGGRDDDRLDGGDEAPELDVGSPIHVPYEVDLPGFSGPLELLLHLIRKHKLDIIDIPVGFITEKYLEYIDAMKVLNLDVASDYLEMAATLTRIKSRMLLPVGEQLAEEGEGKEPEDPRAELVRRLLEYEKYRDAADKLGALSQLHRDVFARPPEHSGPGGDRPLAEVGIGALLDAFAAVLKRVKPDLAREVTVERISVANRIQELVAFMETRHRVRFEQLFERIVNKFDVVVTFLALLEMTKLHMARLLQAGPGTPLLIDYVGRASDVAAGAITADERPVEPEPGEKPPTVVPAPPVDEFGDTLEVELPPLAIENPASAAEEEGSGTEKKKE